MLMFVRKLTSILEDKSTKKNIPDDCITNIKWVRNQKAFIMLFSACRNLSKNEFRKKVAELDSLHAYPQPFGRYKLLKWLFLNRFVLKLLNNWYNLKTK